MQRRRYISNQLLLACWASLSLMACGGGNRDQSSSISSSLSSSSTSSSSSSIGYIVPDTVTQSVVRFVYFIEQGQNYDPTLHAAIEEQAFAMQLFWHEQFGGTFYLYGNVVEVIYGDHNADWYVSTPDGIHSDPRWYRLGNIKNEVYRKLGVRNFDPKARVVNYPSARFDGRVGGNFGGAWMDGDDLACLTGGNSGYNFPYDEQNPAHCTGHVSHEFGHVFGLDHEGPNDDCMQYGFYISAIAGGGLCDFSDENRIKVNNTRGNAAFLSASPGEVVQPNGQVIAR